MFGTPTMSAHSLSLLAVGAALTLTAGCGKKGPSAAAASDAASTASAITAQMPDSKDAKSFAGKLVNTSIENWEPVSGGGDAKFTYNKLGFQPDGSWSADAVLEASFEEIPCKESGTWAIEEVESADSAIMKWVVDKTGCPTRDAGKEQRVQMLLPKAGDWTINFR